MDIDGVIEVCEKLGLLMGKPYNSPKYGPNVSISCPLAPWTHTDPVDANKSCSVTLDPDGPSKARCHSFSCDFMGSLWFLIKRSVTARDAVTQVAFAEWVARLAKTEEPSLDRDFDRTVATYDAAWAVDAVPVAPIAPTLITPGMALMPKTRADMPRVYERDVVDERFLDQFSEDLPAYVAERGISPETAKRWELRYDPRLGRIVFPCRRYDGALVGVTGRILPSREADGVARGEDITKYHNYSGLNKTRYLYGAHTWKKNRPVVAVEGPFDLLKTWQAIGDRVNVGATLGQGFGEDHRRTVKNSEAPATYLFFDDDLAGRRAAEKVGVMLNDAFPLYVMRPFGGKDPGAMTEPQIEDAYAHATHVIGDIVKALAGVDPLAMPNPFD